MEEIHDLLPEIERYTCVVDLFEHAGSLTDAIKFVNEIPAEPTEMVWQTLLNDCWVHGNGGLGGTTAQKILSVRTEYS
ncbi:unnamed protein product [Spirodela intermedia]|uniref:Uncharacterized protein n=1 Tax=Spirodela intermedia TaxID=51605 RepID=A0A7I8L8W2_SPIIN|nr:unnamed protein product [Spirodela intermedia]